MQMLQKEQDPELSSLPEENEKHRAVHHIFSSDEKSVKSDVTDLTNNTQNRQYHNDEASMQSDNSLISATSVASIQEGEIEAMFDSGMSEEEVERNIQLTTAHKKLKVQQKADMLLALALKKR